jgi:NADPH:quinone reductase-like Zn-dependent oxidoreductase
MSARSAQPGRTVRAAIIDAPGAEPRVGSIELPPRTGGTTLLAVAAAPLNPLDLAIASGTFHSVRHRCAYVPGSECAGVVLDSDRFPAGSVVYAECRPAPASPGALATHVVVADDDVLPLPEGLDPIRGAAVGNCGVAAYIPLIEIGELQPEQCVLVLGASGAVGQIAVQIARRRGAGRVVAVARNRAMLPRLLDLGAHDVVDLREGEGAEELAVRLLEAGGPADLVLDGVYGPVFEAALRACAPTARVINIGNGSGPEARLPAGLLRGKRLTITGFAGLHTPLSEKQAALDWLWSALVRDELRLETRTFGLGRLPEAWSAQAASPHGKCVIVPETPDGRAARSKPARAENTRTVAPLDSR